MWVHGAYSTGALLPSFSMPRFRIFRSPASEWVSSSVGIARGLVSVANCVPFPYVNTALTAGLTLLELIQTVGQSDEDLRYLSESVVAIMKLLREEVESHPTENTPFRNVCEEFTSHLTQLSKDIESMSKNRSSSKLRKYLNSQKIRDEISRFTRRVTDLRANATLVSAVGMRMDLAGVESRISDLIVLQNSSRTKDSTDVLEQELARLEDDFHALKLGDIHLDFGSARSSVARYANDREEKQIGWTDYKATVNGGVRTVRVYQGSDPTKSWKDFLFLLADNSPSAHFPQLFGFCSSPRLRCLVFHGEYRTLDEYGATLPSAQAIVDWELNLVICNAQPTSCTDIFTTQVANLFDLLDGRHCMLNLTQYRDCAMVDAHNGKLILTHIERGGMARTTYHWDHIFITWFAMDMRLVSLNKCHQLAASERDMWIMLESLVNLERGRGYLLSDQQFGCRELLLSRGCVFRDDKYGPRHSFHWPRFNQPVAAFAGRDITPDAAWAAVGRYKMSRCAVADNQLKDGFTQFVVPLNRMWVSQHDGKAHCGYFLDAAIQIGRSVPDIRSAWLAQASSIIPASDGELSKFYIPRFVSLKVSWEMVLAAEDIGTTAESIALLDGLPERIHIFVQVPQINEECVEEPQIYWSTDADVVETQTVPRLALKIRMKWVIPFETVRWENHHYEVAEATQKRLGFDPATNAAAKSLNLPLLEALDVQSSERVDQESNWLGCRSRDPHTLQLIDDPHGSNSQVCQGEFRPPSIKQGRTVGTSTRLG
ncbi:hypothetical protein DFH06DRAFT_1239759 [Mycena polygramma]|nr:hypothetical protein DFH06DRAFT_1239759 [Mycena polygramma]